METTEAIHQWRCIRRFKKDEPVPEDALRKVLEAGRRAPSWMNVQPWHFIVIRDAEIKEKLATLASGQKQIAFAPVVIGVCGDLSAWDKPRNREALLELVEAGAMKLTAEIIDNVVLKDPVFCVAENGPAMILSRTFEQLGITYGFMGIEAVNQGLGMCIIGALGNEVTGANQDLYQEIKASLGIPEKMYLLTILTLGVPDEAPKARPRKDFNLIVSREKVGQKF
ncbi:MAG: nitroreductase family protein [Desulfobacterales bacterium]|jgi:nitroreductase